MFAITKDPDRPRGFYLEVDGTPQSYVDLDDPARLPFEYVARFAHIVDCMPSGPITALHLGGGALSLARYIAHSRPGSRQQALDIDGDLIAAVREQLPTPRRSSIKVRCADARDAFSVLPTGLRGACDLIVIDIFAGARIPARVSSIEFYRSVLPLLTGDGVMLLNLADGAGLGYVRRQIATVRSAFSYPPDVVMAAESGVLKGRRFGNVVVAVSPRPLPHIDIARALASDAFPARIMCGAELDRFVSETRVITDADAADSPAPPAHIFSW